MIPNIPSQRFSVRFSIGVDPRDHREKFCHWTGYITAITETELIFHRDSAANGGRPDSVERISRERIRLLKPIAARKTIPSQKRPGFE